MIAVRIPEEIKKYKEKIAFGLTSRQLVSSIIALAVCVPLYWFGRSYIPEDVLSWLIILIALPLLAIGFFHFNGMPFEKFIVAWLFLSTLSLRRATGCRAIRCGSFRISIHALLAESDL